MWLLYNSKALIERKEHMIMLGFGKKKKEEQGAIYATQTGTVVALTDVPDDVFSKKVLGEGLAIIPTDGLVCSPVSGTIVDVTDTLHAVSITSDDGVDILVHVGLETVALKGEGFIAVVKAGDQIKAGDPILRVDLDFLSQKGLKLHTPTVIPDMDGINLKLEDVTETVAGKTIVARYSKS